MIFLVIIIFQNNPKIINALHLFLRPFMLRRLKSDALKSIPPKTEISDVCIVVNNNEMTYETKNKINNEIISFENGKNDMKPIQNEINEIVFFLERS